MSDRLHHRCRIDELRSSAVLATRRACEGLDDETLARRVAAARETCAADDDDELAPARGILNALSISVGLLLAAFVLVGALSGCGAGLEDPDPRPLLADCPIVANQLQPVCKVPG